MLQRLRSTLSTVRSGINTGILLGLGLIFLTLIGLPSDDSAQLAATAVPLYLFIAGVIGWLVAKQFSRETTRLAIQNAFAAGLSGAIVFLLFLGLINRWHAQGIDVAGLYFANMNTYPMHILSGVPLEELRPNTAVDVITGQLPDDAYIRTNPFTLTFDKDRAIFSIGSLAIGGFYGLAIMLTLASTIGGILEQTLFRIDWRPLRARVREATQGTFFHRTLPTLFHWLILLSPVLIFLMFWATVEHERGTEQTIFSFVSELGLGTNLFGEPTYSDLQLIDLNDTFNLSNESLINDVSIQLGMTFLLIIMAIVALRRAQTDPSRFNYATRVVLNLIPYLVLSLMALWRVETSRINIIAPSFDVLGLDQHDWTLLVMGIGWIVLLAYIIYAQRTPENFELTFAVSLSLVAFLISPLFMTQYQTFVVGRVMLAVMFGLGLNIVVGYAGLLDLGYVAFYAIGAYTFAFIAYESEQFKLSTGQLNTLGWTTLAAIVIAPIFMLLAAQIWQRLSADKSSMTIAESNDYGIRQNYRAYQTSSGLLRKAKVWENQPPMLFSLAIVAIAIVIIFIAGDILQNLNLGEFDATIVSSFLVAIPIALMAGAFAGIMLGFPVLRLRGDYLAIVTLGFGEIISLALKNLDNITGGPSGAIGIPKPVPSGTSIPTSNLILLYISVVGAMIVLYISSNLRHSRIGRAWLAMRSDEDIAQAMGINLVNLKLLAFSLGAAMAALAGMIFASRQSSIFPDDFSLEISINVLSLVIIGGMGSLPGVIVGSIVLIGLPELLRPVADYRIMAFGLLLILTMIVRPEGLMPSPPPELEERARQLAEAEE